MEFKRANTYKAVFFFLFSRKRYIPMAMTHGMAINLEAPDLRKKYEEGTFPKNDWEIEAKRSVLKAGRQIDRGLWGSFSLILLTALVILVIGYFKGAINPSRNFNCNILATFIGTFLASWATLMELGGAFATYSGEALHELIHPVMFKLLFIPGVFFFCY